MAIVKVCSETEGVNLNELSNLNQVRTWSVSANPSHPLFNDFMAQPSGH